MISFFKNSKVVYAVSAKEPFDASTIEKLCWLFGEAQKIDDSILKGRFIGPRKEMISPWSTNAVEITQNMGVEGIERIEEFYETSLRRPGFMNSESIELLLTL